MKRFDEALAIRALLLHTTAAAMFSSEKRNGVRRSPATIEQSISIQAMPWPT